jgi:hypothetical protein
LWIHKKSCANASIVQLFFWKCEDFEIVRFHCWRDAERFGVISQVLGWNGKLGRHRETGRIPGVQFRFQTCKYRLRADRAIQICQTLLNAVRNLVSRTLSANRIEGELSAFDRQMC